MAESSSRVRLLQQHLRQAGISLATHQLDAAAEHIDAALAIDPGSVAALTLRDRLAATRTTASTPATPAVKAFVPKAPPAAGRFIPSGVDAASWTDFEQRVQQRRFRALVEAAERALSSGDHAGARGAIAEARELFPDSGEVALLAGRLALISTPLKEAERERSVFRSRTFRAASLLLAGVTSLMALDWTRSGSATDPMSVASVGTAGVGASDVVPESLPPVADDSASSIATAELPTVEAVIPRGTDTLGEAAERPAERAEVSTPASNAFEVPPAQPSLSARRDLGLSPASSAETPDDFVVPSARVARNTVMTPPVANPPVLRGDVPDSYVAPRRNVPTREAAPVASREAAAPSASAPRPAGAPAPLASVVRQPGPAVEPFGANSSSTPPTLTPVVPPPAAAAPAAVAAVVTRSEENRVRSVLDQYASAFGTLDASAVHAVWPTVNQRDLQRAFDDLSSHKVSFDECEISVNGSTANASCSGTASYVRKVGSHDPRTERRSVKFELKRDGDAWRIQKADTRR